MTWAEYKRTTLAVMRTKRWVTTAELVSGSMSVPAGTVVEIGNKSNGLTVVAPACPHCGVRVFMRKVCPSKLEPADDSLHTEQEVK